MRAQPRARCTEQRRPPREAADFSEEKSEERESDVGHSGERAFSQEQRERHRSRPISRTELQLHRPIMSTVEKLPGSKSDVKDKQSDGIPAHKAAAAPPPTTTTGGAARNIKRRGGGASAATRKAGVTDPTDDGSMEDYVENDPKDPNFEGDDPEFVSNQD